MHLKKFFKRWWRRVTKKSKPCAPFCSDCGELIPEGKSVKCGPCSHVVCIDCWRVYHQWCHGKAPRIQDWQ